LFASLEGNRRKKKTEGVSGRNIGDWKEGFWRLIFLKNIKLSSFVRTKKLHCSNSIYVVIIFLKLKI